MFDFLKRKVDILKEHVSEGIIDGTELSKTWFECIKTDVFLSHSHNDAKLALFFSNKPPYIFLDALDCIYSLFHLSKSFIFIGITKTSAKLIAFIIIILFSLVTGVIWTCFIAKKHMSWSNGDGKINICYADIMKISFPRKSKGKKFQL